MREVQCAETDSSGGLLITSTPLIGVPGGSKFQAVAKLHVTNNADGGTFGCKASVIARKTVPPRPSYCPTTYVETWKATPYKA